MDRNEIVKNAVNRMKVPYTKVCGRLYGALTSLGISVTEGAWKKLTGIMLDGMRSAFEVGMNAYADCVEETVKHYRYEMYYAQDVSHRSNAKRCLLKAKEAKRISDDAFGKYLMESNNEKKAELFKEHTDYARHHKKWLELAEHYYGILRSHGFKC